MVPCKYSNFENIAVIRDEPKIKVCHQAEAIATYIISYHLRQSVQHKKLQGILLIPFNILFPGEGVEIQK